MGERRSWWRSDRVRAVRRRISDQQRLLYPPLKLGTHAWIGIVHHGLRWTESGPFRGFIERGEPAIVCMWHQDVLNTTIYLAAQAPRYPMTFMVSDGRAATLGSYMLGGYGLRLLAGSKHEAGGRVGVVERLAEECRSSGCSAIITGDGSRGPACEARWGAVHLARDTGLPIICMRTWLSRQWLLRFTWCDMALPWFLPGGRAHAASGAPLYVAADANKAALEDCRLELTRRLNDLIPVAETAVSARPVEGRLRYGVPRP